VCREVNHPIHIATAMKIEKPTMSEIFTVADIADFPQSGQLPQQCTCGGLRPGSDFLLQWGHGILGLLYIATQ